MIEVLAYAQCATCKKALAWLKQAGIAHTVRPIVDEPPTPSELKVWIPAAGVPVRRWLNTSGQSYRALGGREHFDALDDASIAAALAADGKLVKRPVLVMKRGAKVVVRVGFDADAWQELLG
jgi:arsenate reductase